MFRLRAFHGDHSASDAAAEQPVAAIVPSYPTQLSEKQLQELKEMFEFVDADKNGLISLGEFTALLSLCRVNAPPADVSAMFSEIDTDGSGSIDFDEFTTLLANRTTQDYSAADLAAAFRVFETTDVPEGVVKSSVLRYAFATFGPSPLSADDSADLMALMDPAGAGHVKYLQFAKMLA